MILSKENAILAKNISKLNKEKMNAPMYQRHVKLTTIGMDKIVLNA